MTKISSVLLLLIFATSSVVFSADKIIFFDKATDANKRAESVKKLGGSVKKDLPEIYATVVDFPATKSASFKLSAVKAIAPTVVDAEDNLYTNWLLQDRFNTSLKSIMEPPRQLNITPISTSVKETETQQTPWGIGRVESNAAWKRGYTGKGVTVAVIDTGVKLSHPDLKANIIGGYNAVDESKPADDKDGHGTHVSGTIAAINNKIGVVGVAHEAKIMPVKVLSDDGYGSAANVAAGLIWAANNGAQVVNMSLGSRFPSKVIEEALQYALSKNVTVVCAAGNDGGAVNYPGAYDGAIAVSASDKESQIAYFSSRGKQIAFIAPGVRILSTTAATPYDTYDGTSMASPHIAGLAALAVQAGAKTPSEVLEALKFASRPLKGLTEVQQGNGFVKGRWIGER